MRIITYFRVSTARQGASGLGLEAQEAAVAAMFPHADVIATYTEIESGTKSDRPKLAAAVALAKKEKVKLVIAKLDRLARNVHFISGLMESGIEFTACDMPDANDLTVNIMSSMAQHEAQAISARTKAALGAAKARGVVLGGDRGKLDVAREAVSANADARAETLMKQIERITRGQPMSLRQIAVELNTWGVKTPRGGSWSASTVQRAMQRAA
jgi:DNA invertase Pin-like site-specific DNA recombinase